MGASSDEDSPDEDEDAEGSPAPLERSLPSHDEENRSPPASKVGLTPSEHAACAFQEQLASPCAPSSASQSRSADGNNSVPRTLEIKAPVTPMVSDLQINFVQSQHHEVCNKTRYL